MLVRISPMLQHSATASIVIISFGLLTALIAAFSAMNQYDIKKVLAYSTNSHPKNITKKFDDITIRKVL